LTARTRVACLPVAVHDTLQDGGEGCDTNAGANKDGVLSPEDVARRGPIWTINDNL
jgi:hypothetical protein